MRSTKVKAPLQTKVDTIPVVTPLPKVDSVDFVFHSIEQWVWKFILRNDNISILLLNTQPPNFGTKNTSVMIGWSLQLGPCKGQYILDWATLNWLGQLFSGGMAYEGPRDSESMNISPLSILTTMDNIQSTYIFKAFYWMNESYASICNNIPLHGIRGFSLSL